VPEQIAVLLALTAELFDHVPLDQMTDAEHALRKAAADIPAEVRDRLDTADKLSDEDRKTIVEIARKSLAGFQPKPDTKSKPEQQTVEKSKPQAAVGPKTESKPEPKPEPKQKAGAKPDETRVEPKPTTAPRGKS
jgi:F-type H+-transporting ATPase subunit alpha